MLTTLAAIKSRLSILDTDPQYDQLLTTAIKSVSTRFDKESNRTLARTENAVHEFDPTDTEILPSCYPIESISKFEIKTSGSHRLAGSGPRPPTTSSAKAASSPSLPRRSF